MVMNKMKSALHMLLLVVGLLIFTFVIPGQGIGGKIPKPEGYPSKSLEYVVPWGAGGGSGHIWPRSVYTARREMGASVVVVNLPGGAGAVGTEYVMKQPANGYTLFGITNDLDCKLLTGQILVYSSQRSDPNYPCACGCE